MGGGASSNKQPKVPIPQYAQSGMALPPYNISRPPSPPINSSGGTGGLPINSRQQRQLNDAYQTIQRVQNQIAMQSAGAPMMNSLPPIPALMQPNSYPPPSPILQRFTGPTPYTYQPPPQQQAPAGNNGFRDSDYAAVANIAGLNPADVAILHREYVNVTRGGANKLDRVVFRQLLREAMIEANNENIDRAIENIFVTIDRNHDGFIDFPEFIGAFRDLLKGNSNDSNNYLAQHAIPDLINQQMRACSNTVSSPVTLIQQPVQQPYYPIQQNPIVLSVDSNQSPFIINPQGQNFLSQPAGIQCASLPIL